MKVKVLDKKNDFRLVVELDFSLASCLNIGDSISPEGTGFSFTIVDKFLTMENNEYNLRLNVIEYMPFMEKVKMILFGIKRNSYFDYKQRAL